jgi:hypothetical protein
MRLLSSRIGQPPILHEDNRADIVLKIPETGLDKPSNRLEKEWEIPNPIRRASVELFVLGPAKDCYIQQWARNFNGEV